ncbi:hypothetical protein [Shewanella marina]|uniref:hypothetical protein n=1 Tax=Shewanella marina TaxID=487319 RepID=UPI00046FEFD3|nr:hypothetical protein [Shewanella marina]
MTLNTLIKLGCITSLSLALSACVKMQVLPEDGIQKSINAGKGIYTDTKMLITGGVKKSVSKQVNREDYENITEAEQTCLDSLKQRLIAESTENPVEILYEKIAIVTDQEKIIECQIEAYIWPKQS